MKYAILTAPSIGRKCSKIEISELRKIKRKIEKLADNPFPPEVKKLRHREFDGTLKLRIGEFRVLYQVFEGRVLILDIYSGHRENT